MPFVFLMLYGHPPGSCALVVVGLVTVTRRLETGNLDREGNMQIFTGAALELMQEALDQCQ